MTGTDLYNALNRLGVEKDARKIAVTTQIAPVEDIALMDMLELCNLIMREYEMIMEDYEKILLVPRYRLDVFKSISAFLGNKVVIG